MVEVIVCGAMIVVISLIAETRVSKSNKKVKLLKDELVKSKLREEERKIKLLELAKETAKFVESSEIIYQIAKEEVGEERLERLYKERKDGKDNKLNELLKAMMKERKDKAK